LADGTALHGTRTKQSSAVGSENTQKHSRMGLLLAVLNKQQRLEALVERSSLGDESRIT
jgi:hypothetical protein